MEQTQQNAGVDARLVEQIVSAILSLSPEEQDAIFSRLEEVLGGEENEEQTSDENDVKGNEGKKSLEEQKQDYIRRLAM